MARVFVSHASDDRELAGELHQWLTDDGHEVFLDQDLRDGIAVGEAWEQRLYERLRWADAVVCVVTSAYLASTWCTAEVGIARSQGSRLLPLLSEPGVDHPLLTATQYADHTRDPAAAHTALREALRRVDAAGGLGWADGRSPYPGLRPFDIDLHRVFFGRTGEVETLAGLLRSPAERADAGLLLVVGPSGCGKSSLVRAGLVPVMADEPGWLTLPPLVPGTDPVATLVRELAAGGRQLGAGWTLATVRDQLSNGGLREVAEELLLAASDGGRRWRLLVVVDQFEELLTQTAAAERGRFAELLRPALGGPVQVVATLRPEFLAQLLASGELAGLPVRPVPLRPLRREALKAVIEGPARVAGIGVDQQLVARLVADTDTGEALPLLAFTLEQLAEGVGRGGQLSEQRYDELGGVQGALTRQADAALAEALAAGGRSRQEVLAGLLRLVTVDEHGRPTRWRVNREELPELVRLELDAFGARRLMVTDTDNGTVVVGVAHEAFLTAWPPLAEAIGAAASALRMRRAVEQAAADWDHADRPPARLWERGQLAAAVADTGARIRPGPRSSEQPSAGTPRVRQRRPAGWLPGGHRVLVTEKVELSQRAREFLHASIRRDRRRRARAVGILSGLLVLAVIAAGLAYVGQRAAQQQLRVATARQVIARADEVRESDPGLALRLGIAAQHLHDDGETQASLVHTLTTTHYAGTLTGHNDWVSSVAFSPTDRHTLASGSLDETVRLWDVADRAHPVPLGQPLTGHNDWVSSLVFSPDGRTLASSGSNTVRLWNVTDRARPVPFGPPLTHSSAVFSVAFSPADGRTLASGSGDKTVRLWNVTDPAHPTPLGRPLTGHNDSVLSVAFSPTDGRTLASGGGNTVRLWNVADPARPLPVGQPLTGHKSLVDSVAFSPDGRTLASASGSDKTVRLWNVADRAHPTPLGRPLTGHRDSVASVAFSPTDGRILASGSDDTTVRLWNVADRAHPTPLGQPLTGHDDFVDSVAFSSDGRTLASGSKDGTVGLWDVADRARPVPLREPMTHIDSVDSMAFSPTDGRTLASSAGDKVRLWNVTDRAHPVLLGQPLTHSNSVSSVAFSPDGRTLASSTDKTVHLWNVADRARPVLLGQPLTHSNWVSSVAFSPDGQMLASGSHDNTVRLWNVADRTHPVPLGQPLTGHNDLVLSLAFSPDRRTLASSADDTVRLWDVADPARPTPLGPPLTGHSNSVASVAFSPTDGRTLASGGDMTVRLWNVADRAQPVLLGQPLTSHNHFVNSVAFSPDGRILASGSADDKVRLWDVADPARPVLLGQPLTHSSSVSSVGFSPDGRTLASSADDKVRLWDLTELSALLHHAAERACSLTGRGLNRGEWARYVEGLPYESTCRR